MMETDDPEQEFVRQLTLHQGALLAYIRSLMGGYPGTQDILQQANLKLWEMRGDFTPGTNFKSWAFAVARFSVLSQRRRLKRDGWLVFGEIAAEKLAQDLAEDRTDSEEALHALDVCLSRLRPQDRELVRVRYATHRGLGEFARMLNRSSGTLKARLFKIRALLRRCIEGALSGEEFSP